MVVIFLPTKFLRYKIKGYYLCILFSAFFGGSIYFVFNCHFLLFFIFIFSIGLGVGVGGSQKVNHLFAVLCPITKNKQSGRTR